MTTVLKEGNTLEGTPSQGMSSQHAAIAAHAIHWAKPAMGTIVRSIGGAARAQALTIGVVPGGHHSGSPPAGQAVCLLTTYLVPDRDEAQINNLVYREDFLDLARILHVLHDQLHPGFIDGAVELEVAHAVLDRGSSQGRI